MNNPDVLIIDTRSDGERRTSHIQGTTHIPFYELAARSTELQHEKEIWVHCASGYRASVALGILESAGYRAVLINDDYQNSAHIAGLKIITGIADAVKP